MINPLAQAIQDARYSLITHQTQTVYQIFGGGWHELIPFGLVLIVFIIGFTYFKKEAKSFAENV
jgi:ABC-2 type transport system permease protein